MKFARSSLLLASMALTLPNPKITADQGQIGIAEVPSSYAEFQEDFERFTVWHRGGNGGKAEPVYDGVGGSRALMIIADGGDIDVYRLLDPREKWQVSFDVKDLTETREGSWQGGINETPEKIKPRDFKRAYFVSLGGFDAAYGVYSEKDDDIRPVKNDVRKGRVFHSYSIKCDGSKVYFGIDGETYNPVPGNFKPGKIFARLRNGGHIILDNVSFRP